MTARQQSEVEREPNAVSAAKLAVIGEFLTLGAIGLMVVVLLWVLEALK